MRPEELGVLVYDIARRRAGEIGTQIRLEICKGGLDEHIKIQLEAVSN